MVETIYTGSCSACFEMKNNAPYYAPAAYRVRLNGAPVYAGDTNVFSLFGLQPDTDYHLDIETDNNETFAAEFHTRPEACALNVKDFGAKGDGQTDDTAAIQRAVLLLPSGGRLVFPEGVYHNKSKYPVIPALVPDMNSGDMVETGSFEGLARDMYASLLTAEYAEDITIVGPGKVDGDAQNAEWWQTFKTDPVARPRLLFFNRCRNVTVHGISAANSASWQLHPYNSSNVAFYDVFVSAPKDSPNTDALDPESCDGVEICANTV